ncbi:MAG: 6-carboxytetrahydropterin synthase QueD [Candidatus Omnitrophica bacterium]|nr:6-carboxytetrahydropterin synthase QueD [Candidatus Omnitrophota bacterium]
MFEISVVRDFSAAHNLRHYQGKCEKLHGHNWQVEAVFAAPDLGSSEMVLDFKDAGKLLEEILEQFDHQYINETEYFSRVNPTSENIARYIYRNLAEKIKAQNCRVCRVSVWETQKNRATYYE